VPPRVIVCAVANAVGSKSMVLAPAVAFACATAQARLPDVLALPDVFMTVNVDGQQRSSSCSRTKRTRRGALRIVRGTGRVNNLRIQDRIVMGSSDYSSAKVNLNWPRINADERS
jgi:hypothetical protein